ncbi:MAG: polyprenyl synthetase family protein [Candidatus Aenigmatarchaeota archaeon]
MDIEKIISENSHLIDKEIESVFPKDGIKNLNDAIWYHLGTGGKRIRPILAILTCKALDGEIKKVLPFAAACEILHNWLLIHDDIEDGDVVRRNQPTVWSKYGLAHGINVGDYMAHKVFELVLRCKDNGADNETVFRLIEALTITISKTAEGQTMDINMRTNNNPTEDDYMKTITGKTAYYFTIPIVGGAIIAGADSKIIDSIIKFGMNAGPAFQIADDILDMTEGKGRNEIGRDIKEGKRSIMVVHCLSRCNNDERKRLLQILSKPADKTAENEVDYAKELFEKYGSIDYARKKAEELVEKAKDAIKNLPPELKEVLDFFADYVMKRRK